MLDLLRIPVTARLMKRVAWVVLVLVSAAWGLPLWLVAALLLVLVLEPAVRALRRASKKVRARSLPQAVFRGTVEPPTERHAYKPPTTVGALITSLELADAGTITPRADGARVALEDGGWAGFTAALPDKVTQNTISLEGDSVASLALLCDALARELGPMRLDVDGVQLVIDGTRPRGLLLRDVSDAVETHARRMRNQPATAPPPPGLLH